MSKISELLEPIKAEHVEKAIEKFNGMGREEFLKEYGFGKAKTCWLVYEGVDYDSKAIIGVAHSFIDKESVPLTPRDNPPYGGNPTLSKLSELGFECWKEKDVLSDLNNIGVNCHASLKALSKNSRSYQPASHQYSHSLKR